MKKILTLILLLGGVQAYGQIVVETDTITVGNTSGAGGVSLFGKAYLKNISFGTSHDSVLVRNANGSIRMVPRSSFGLGGSGAYLPLSAGSGSPLAGDLYINANIGLQGAPTNFGTGYRAVTINGTSGGIFESKSTSVTARLAADEGVGSGIINVATTHPLQFWTNATNRYEISATGNHDFKSGTATFGGYVYTTDRFYTAGNTPGSSWISDALTSGYRSSENYGWITSATELRLGAGGTNRYSIDASGNHDFKSGSATFGNDITLNNTDASSFHGMTFTNNGNTDAYIRQKAVSGELRIANGRNAGWGGVTYFDIDGSERARISASAYTLSVPLTGTSATFSGNISSTGSYSTSTALYTPHADINNNANTSTSWENAGLRLTGTTHPGMAFYIPGTYAATISLSPSGILTASTNFHSGGNITASNLNISNWNTAYGWGNHASAGYLTSGSLSSYLALTGGTLSGTLGGTSASFSGNITAGGDITANSDARLKKDIRPLDDVTAQLRSLNAVSYRMKADNTLHIGLVAQEVEKQFPLLVRKADDIQGTLSVNYQAMTAPLLKGWQEHDAVIRQQADKIKTQEEMIGKQQQSISQLQKEVDELKQLIKQAIHSK